MEFLGNKSLSEIQDFYKDNNYIIVDLEPHKNGKYSAVFIEQFGTPKWSFRTSLTYNQIRPTVLSRDMRIIDLERYKNTFGNIRYSLVMVTTLRIESTTSTEKQ